MKRKIINYIGLFLLLVVLPGMSWVYLSSGLSYQKAKRAELRRFGAVPAFPYVLMNGDTTARRYLQESCSLPLTLMVGRVPAQKLLSGSWKKSTASLTSVRT